VVNAPGTSPLTPDEPVLSWARDLVTPSLRKRIDELPPPERRIARYHRGWGGDGDSLDGAADSAAGSGSGDGGGPLAGPLAGKGVRPSLALLGALAVGADAECAVPAAVAVELVHDFSLLHDDIIDRDALRRHRPAAWTVFGTAAALLTGDALMASALGALTDSSVPGALVAVREFSRALTRLTRGQSQDVAFESRRSVTAQEYLGMAEDKTGSLMGCACALGAQLGGAPEHRVAGLRGYGRHLGVAFQCVDDLLGIRGSTASSGKPVGSDLAARKKTLPVVAALSADGSPAARRLAALYSRPEPFGDEDVARAARLVDEAGGLAYTEGEATRQTAAALRCLAAAQPAPRAYQGLCALARSMTGRDR
jgi:geranylgeranyl diphosphate synthase type I